MLTSMAKPRIVTALHEWMRENWLGDKELAEKLNAMPQLNGRKPVNARQIARWRKGLAVPRPYYIVALTVLSEGRVGAEHFVQAVLLTEEEEPPDAES
jgi:hypothetical protein